jgi:cell division protein FtsA
MSKGTVVSGIDLGSSKITTIIAQVAKDEVTLENEINLVGVSSVASRGIKKGQIIDIEEAVEATIESVEGAERMAGYNLDQAYISVGGANINSQNSHGVVAVSDSNGEIVNSDIERVIEAASAISLPASRQILHTLPKEYTVDGESGIRDPIGMSGIRLEVQTHLITSSTAAIKNIKKAVNEVGVNIVDMVYTGIASSYSTLTKTEKELGCVLIDIGGGTTSVTVYVEGGIESSFVLPIGANNVTNDLAIGLRLSLETAEKIKLALSNEAKNKKKTQSKDKDKNEDEFDLNSIGITDVKKVSRKTLVEGIIRPRLNEIFTMVRIQLEREGLISKVPSGAILVGGGAQTVGITDSAKRTLSLPVRIGKPKGVGGLVDDVLNPQYTTPIGLILYGVNAQAAGFESEGFVKKFKLPTKGIAGKLIDTFKDLLP